MISASYLAFPSRHGGFKKQKKRKKKKKEMFLSFAFYLKNNKNGQQLLLTASQWSGTSLQAQRRRRSLFLFNQGELLANPQPPPSTSVDVQVTDEPLLALNWLRDTPSFLFAEEAQKGEERSRTGWRTWIDQHGEGQRSSLCLDCRHTEVDFSSR